MGDQNDRSTFFVQRVKDRQDLIGRDRASIALAQAALVKVGGDEVENDAAITTFRRDYYAEIEK